MAITGDTFVEATADTSLDEHTPTGANAGSGWTQHETPGPSGDLKAKFTADNCGIGGNNDDKNSTVTLQDDPTNAEYDIQFTLKGIGAGAPANTVGPMARRASDTSSYIANIYRVASNPDATIYIRTGAEAGTQLASADMTPAVDDIIKFEIRNAAKKLFRDPDGLGFDEIISTANDDITAAGGAGLSMGNSVVSTDDCAVSWLLDDFTITEAVAAAPPFLPFHSKRPDVLLRV